MGVKKTGGQKRIDPIFALKRNVYNNCFRLCPRATKRNISRKLWRTLDHRSFGLVDATPNQQQESTDSKKKHLKLQNSEFFQISKMVKTETFTNIYKLKHEIDIVYHKRYSWLQLKVMLQSFYTSKRLNVSSRLLDNRIQWRTRQA